MALLAVGYTFTRARRVIILEPDYVVKNELQVRQRVHRIGQEYETTSYRIYGDTEIEMRIVKTQHNRALLGRAAIEELGMEDLGRAAIEELGMADMGNNEVDQD